MKPAKNHPWRKLKIRRCAKCDGNMPYTSPQKIYCGSVKDKTGCVYEIHNKKARWKILMLWRERHPNAKRYKTKFSTPQTLI